MARKLTVEEMAKARLGYFWDLVPEATREAVRREVAAEDKGRGGKHGAAVSPRRNE